MKLALSFGEWLADRRGDMPIQGFALRVGVNPGTISRAERNSTDVLVSTAIRICRGLGLSLTDLFEDWQGVHLPAATQHIQETWQGALMRRDLQRWLVRVLEGNRRNQEMLIIKQLLRC